MTEPKPAKHYAVWLTSLAPFVLPSTLEFEFSDAKVYVRNLLTPLPNSESPEHLGLHYLAIIQQPDVRASFAHAVNAASVVNDLLAAVHSVDLPDPRPTYAIDLDSRNSAREFGQFVDSLPLTRFLRRHFREPAFRAFFDRWGPLPPSPLKNRLLRAFALHRRSISETDLLDMFEDLWGALEALNLSLQERHSLPKTYPGKPCPNCGAATEVPGSSAGIRHAVIALANFSVADWNTIRQLRVDIVHGLVDHAQLAPRLPAAIPILRKALICAVADLLEIKGQSVQDLQW